MHENSAQLSAHIIALEKNPDDKELITEMMRASHSCKGLCSTMNYTATAELCHVLEDIFDGARNDTVSINSNVIDICLESIDALDASIKNIEKNNEELTEFEVLSELLNVTNAKTKPKNISTKKTSETPVKEVPEESIVSEISHVRVATKKLDTLLDLAGELSLLKLQFAMTEQGNDSMDTASFIEQFGRLTESLTYNIVESRLIPLEQAFMQFPRMVRDLSKGQGKEVELTMTGVDLELDKTLVDHLSTPLIHILRNAVDHGIEKKEEREKEGKSAKGTISITVKREHGFAVVIIEDDGKLISFPDVRNIAKTRGFSDEELSAISDDSLLNILCDPRFSSSTEITETSGRGVGLSAVKETVQSLGGQFTLTQNNNKKQFTLSLPLQLSIIRALLVEANEETYALPFVHVRRLLRVPTEEILSTLGQPSIIIDGEDVPLISLCETFSKKKQEKLGASIQVVLVDYKDGTTGLIVDNIHSNEEIMVKPVADVIKGVECFSGSTILGDGNVAMIIDVFSLLHSNTATTSSTKE